MPQGRKVTSKAQWRMLWALHSRGGISKRKLKDMLQGVKYGQLPERVGKGRVMKRRRKTRRGLLRRRNVPPFALETRLGRRTQRDYYEELKKRLARKRKFGYSLWLRRKGFGRYRGLSEKARHIGRPVGSKKHKRARSRSGKRHMAAAYKRKLMAGLHRWQRKHSPKTHTRARKRHVSRKAIAAMRRGWKRWTSRKKHGRATRIRALKKARKVRIRKLYGRRPLIRKVVYKVKRYRPRTRISLIRRILARDLRRKAHRHGRGRSVKTLTKDVVFGIDFRRALKGQHIRPKNMRHGSWIRRMGRHPSHLRRRLPRHVVRGWKEFAGTKPNLVASFHGSPVRGTFNGVLIQTLSGHLAHSGISAKIVPPTGKELWFTWSNGGRTFEVVGGPSAITALAKAMARGGSPIRLNRIDYAAPRYPVAVKARRTQSTRMSIVFYHIFRHECYLSWNGKFGSKARFPIIVHGARGASMVNRSGIIL